MEANTPTEIYLETIDFPLTPVTSRSNHLFAALYAYVKLEWLRKATQLNRFALKTKLYVGALHAAFDSLRQLNPIQLPA